MAVAELLTETQDRMLSELEANSQRVIEFNKKAAETFQGMIPTQLVEEMPSIPGIEELPTPTEMLDNYFEFAGKLSEASHTFYKELFAIWAPAE
jgi:hypothetical protein